MVEQYTGRLEHKAPQGKIRVIGYDSFSNEDYFIGDYEKYEIAEGIAKQKAGTMNLIYLYNYEGKQLAKFGSY